MRLDVKGYRPPYDDRLVAYWTKIHSPGSGNALPQSVFIAHDLDAHNAPAGIVDLNVRSTGDTAVIDGLYFGEGVAPTERVVVAQALLGNIAKYVIRALPRIRAVQVPDDVSVRELLATARHRRATPAAGANTWAPSELLDGTFKRRRPLTPNIPVVSKALQLGKRGGLFYMNAAGKPVYVKTAGKAACLFNGNLRGETGSVCAKLDVRKADLPTSVQQDAGYVPRYGRFVMGDHDAPRT